MNRTEWFRFAGRLIGMSVEALEHSERPLRRDAERNRRRILDAARGAFAERGLQVPMEEIARRAGVGVGTLYRRFASREALIDALFEERMSAMVTAGEAARREPDAWNGLCSFLERMIAAQAADRGLKEIMVTSGHGCARVEAMREALVPVIEDLLQRAVAGGGVRGDLEPTDLALVNLMVGGVVDHTAEVAPDVWRRALGLLLDGLRARRDAPGPLAAPALTMDELNAVLASHRPRTRLRGAG
jgi:AcrR family transcriptional regulator